MKKYYHVCNDIIFKKVFADKELMKELLEEILECEVKIIKYEPTEQTRENYHERGKRLDLVISIENKIINVEINTSYDSEKLCRNFAYLCKMHAQNINKNDLYALQEESLQINLNLNEGIKKAYKREFVMYCPKEEVALGVKFKYIEVNLDKYRALWYDKKEKEIKKNSMLVALSITEKEELDEYVGYIKNDSIRKVRDEVMYLNENGDYVSELSWEERIKLEHEQDLILKTDRAQKEGMKQGIEQGADIERMKLVKNMLKNNMKDKDILKISGLSKEELSKIKEENK